MKSILIVDDSAFARRTLKHILRPTNAAVHEAKDGHEALEQYFLRRPQLVLLDLVMNHMDGLQVLSKLRELDPAAEVVITSAHTALSTPTEARDLGAAGYLLKPFNPNEVLRTVSRLLPESARANSAESGSPTSNPCRVAPSVRYLLRDLATQHFYQGPGVWTAEPEQALYFSEIQQGVEFCDLNHLIDAEVVACFARGQLNFGISIRNNRRSLVVNAV